jgi:hypothetical protein
MYEARGQGAHGATGGTGEVKGGEVEESDSIHLDAIHLDVDADPDEEPNR